MTCDALDDAAHFPPSTLRAPSRHQFYLFLINLIILKAQPCQMVLQPWQRRRRSTSTSSPSLAFSRKSKRNIKRRRVTLRMLFTVEALLISKLINLCTQPVMPCPSVLIQIHCLLYSSSKFDKSHRSGRLIEHYRR